MSLPEPIEEQILSAFVARLQGIEAVMAPWYVPRFIDRQYRLLDSVNELPGYTVLLAPEESHGETGDLSGAVHATIGIEVLVYAAGNDAEPTDRVLIRMLAQAERALTPVALLGPTVNVDVENTRRVLDHETEVGAPWRGLRSHLYRVRYQYPLSEP